MFGIMQGKLAKERQIADLEEQLKARIMNAARSEEIVSLRAQIAALKKGR
jgi:hypothetical protein